MATPTEGGKEAASGLPQLDFSTWGNQIFWLIVALVVLYFLMSRIALPRIAGVIEDRADAIADDLDSAADFKRKAEQAEAAYEEALSAARAEAQKIAADARAEVQKELDIALAKADAEIAAQTSESEARIAEIRESAKVSIQDVANETAGAVIEAILPGMGNDAAVKAAVKARMN